MYNLVSSITLQYHNKTSRS